MHAFAIAATHSGAGKTTITLALLSALSRRGLRVQSFKAGPDYIDPLHHAVLTGRPAHNLDTWMLPEEAVREIFGQAGSDADVALLEGVMGLFDGVDGVREEGSTSHLAKLLGLPVVLVVDARSMARSAAALAEGFVNFDPDLTFAGIIWNRVGSPTHRRILDEAAKAAKLPPVLGALGRDEGLYLGERHLGLVTPSEVLFTGDWAARLADAAESQIDLDRLLTLTKKPTGAPPRPPARRAAAKKTIAVARDQAFCFYYEENFRIMEELGAKLLFFRPTDGDGIPPQAEALYLGGGYPELHAEALSKNDAFMGGVRSLHARGLPIYAECGGFMALCADLHTGEAQKWPMASIFPADTIMNKRLARLGYREVTGATGTPIAGLTARGHEFHYSKVEGMPEEVQRAYSVKNARGEELLPEGYLVGATLGGYMHLHFASNKAFAAGLFGLG